MLRGVITWVIGVAAGIVVLGALTLAGSLDQSPVRYPHAIQDAGLAQAQTAHHDDHQPCQDGGTLPEPGCCAVVHSVAAAVLPLIDESQRVPPARQTSYSTTVAPSTDGFLADPVLPPPRAVV